MIEIKSKLIKENDILFKKDELELFLKGDTLDSITNEDLLKRMKGPYGIKLETNETLPLYAYDEYFCNKDKTFVTSKNVLDSRYSFHYKEIFHKYFYSKEPLTFMLGRLEKGFTSLFQITEFELYIENDKLIINFMFNNEKMEKI